MVDCCKLCFLSLLILAGDVAVFRFSREVSSQRTDASHWGPLGAVAIRSELVFTAASQLADLSQIRVSEPSSSPHHTLSAQPFGWCRSLSCRWHLAQLLLTWLPQQPFYLAGRCCNKEVVFVVECSSVVCLFLCLLDGCGCC